MIHLQTFRETIRSLADRYERQYPSSKPWPHFDRDGNLARLRALDVETATEQDVEATGVNASWFRSVCDGCEAPVSEFIAVDDGESTTCLCLRCIRTSLQLLEDNGRKVAEGKVKP